MSSRWLLLFVVAVSSAAYGDEQPKLTVTGQGKVTVKADVADVNIGFEVQAKSAFEVQQILSEKLKPIIEKIKALNPIKLETGTMQITPEYDDSHPPRIAGYKGNSTLVFSVEAGRAGGLVDEAIAAGANQLNGISMHPADEALRKGRLEALKAACENAMQEAQTVIKTLGLQKNAILQVSVDPGYIPLQAPRYFQKGMLLAANATSTEVLEQEQTLTASVQINIGIKN